MTDVTHLNNHPMGLRAGRNGGFESLNRADLSFYFCGVESLVEPGDGLPVTELHHPPSSRLSRKSYNPMYNHSQPWADPAGIRTQVLMLA